MPAPEPIHEPTLHPIKGIGKMMGEFKQICRIYLERARTHNAAFLYTGASLMVSIGAIVAATFTMRWVSPEDLGYWRIARSFLPSAMLVLAGINNGLSRDLPYYFGKSDIETANRLAGTTQFFILMASMLVLVAGLGSLAYCHADGARELFTIAAVTGLIIASFYTNYLIVTFRSSKAFKSFSKYRLTEAVLTVATIPLIAWFTYAGMVTRTLLLAAVVVLMMHWLRPVRVASLWNTEAFWLLLKTGAPIFVFDYLTSNVSNTDTWVLAYVGGEKAVGYFALATMAREAISKVPDALGEYIYPRMSHSYGEHNDPIRLWRMAVKSSLLVMAFMVPAVIAGWFILPPFVTHFFPKYTAAVQAAQLVLVGSIFGGATIGKLAIWSMKDWKLMGTYQILNCIFIAAGPLIGACLDGDLLLNVSIGIVSSQVLWIPVAGYLVYRATHRSPTSK